VQHALASSPEDASLRDFEARLLRDKRISPFAQSTGRSIVWKHGFIHAAQIGETSGLARLLAHPAARFLRTLWLHQELLVKMLDDGPQFSHLAELVLLCTGNVTLDLRKYRRLAMLEVEADVAALSHIPEVQRLHVRTRASSPVTAAAIACMPAQRLVELELGFEELVDTQAAVALCTRVDLTALRVVRLRTALPSVGDNNFMRALLDAPFAHQLETIDLTDTWITRDLADLLVEHRDRLPALQHLYIGPRDAIQNHVLTETFGLRLRAERVPRPFAKWPG
jgi:hypothetical protein